MLNKNKPFSLHLNPEMFVPATDAEKEYISRMRPSSTFFRDGCKRLLKNKVATVSLIIIVLITLAVIFLPMFWPYLKESCSAVHSFLFRNRICHPQLDPCRVHRGFLCPDHSCGKNRLCEYPRRMQTDYRQALPQDQ